MKKKIICLLTDFGSNDHYVGVMKGVMLKIDPELCFIDISHTLPPFNILSAAYLLYSSWDYFPEGSVFLSVVDPGVGTSRKTIVYELDGKFLVTPDNGTISLLERMHDNGHVFFVSDKTINRIMISESSTFHGRDIFSPLAAHCAGAGLKSLGLEKGNPVICKNVWSVINARERIVAGRIMHIDRFGNCISTVYYSDLSRIKGAEPCNVNIGNITISGVKKCFSDVRPGEPLVYTGSSGFFELGIREGNAARLLHIKQDMEIIFKM